MGEETWRYVLTVEGRPVELKDGEATFGRSRTSTIRLDHESVSRSHALLTLHRGGVTIRDLNSSNGTWVGGRRITGETSLADGTRVQLGAAVVELKIVSPSVPSERTALLDSTTQPPAASLSRSGGSETPEEAPPPPAAPPASVTQVPFTASNLFSDVDRQARETAGEAAIHEDLLGAAERREPEAAPSPPVPEVPPPPPPSAAEVSLAIGGPVPPRAGPRPRTVERRGMVPSPDLSKSGGVPRRFAALLVDGVIVSAMDVLLFTPAFLILYFRPSLQPSSAAADPLLGGIGLLCFALAFVANVLYTAGLWALRGRTPGKALLGLEVVRQGGRSGGGIGWNAALLRFLVMALGALPLGFGWWMAAFRKDGRALHDIAAGTWVVRKR
ncbi:MAG: FHA domain-containing protein [Acidithiobacillales bacterium]